MYISRAYCKIDILGQMIIEKKRSLLTAFLILKKNRDISNMQKRKRNHRRSRWY